MILRIKMLDHDVIIAMFFFFNTSDCVSKSRTKKMLKLHSDLTLTQIRKQE